MLLASALKSPVTCRRAAKLPRPRRPQRLAREDRQTALPIADEERMSLETLLGYRFADPERLDLALTHRSLRQGSEGTDNERLEFLGDRVLGLAASEKLYQMFPDWEAGKLSKGLA